MNNLEWINGLTVEEWNRWCMAEHDESRTGDAMADRVDYWRKACQTAQRKSTELRAKLSYALDERDRLQEELGARESAVGALKIAVKNETALEARVSDLTEELANRDKGIDRLKRRRDELRDRIVEVEAEREQWRRAFGAIMDGLHELQRFGTLEAWERPGADETMTGAEAAREEAAREVAQVAFPKRGDAEAAATENM